MCYKVVACFNVRFRTIFHSFHITEAMCLQFPNGFTPLKGSAQSPPPSPMINSHRVNCSGEESEEPCISAAVRTLRAMTDAAAYSYLPKMVQDQVLSGFATLDAMRLGMAQDSTTIAKNWFMDSVKAKAVHFVWWIDPANPVAPHLTGQEAIDMTFKCCKDQVAKCTRVSDADLSTQVSFNGTFIDLRGHLQRGLYDLGYIFVADVFDSPTVCNPM